MSCGDFIVIILVEMFLRLDLFEVLFYKNEAFFNFEVVFFRDGGFLILRSYFLDMEGF